MPPVEVKQPRLALGHNQGNPNTKHQTYSARAELYLTHYSRSPTRKVLFALFRGLAQELLWYLTFPGLARVLLLFGAKHPTDQSKGSHTRQRLLRTGLMFTIIILDQVILLFKDFPHCRSYDC